MQNIRVIPKPVSFINKHQRSSSIFSTYSKAFVVWNNKARELYEGEEFSSEEEEYESDEDEDEWGRQGSSYELLLCAMLCAMWLCEPLRGMNYLLVLVFVLYELL